MKPSTFLYGKRYVDIERPKNVIEIMESLDNRFIDKNTLKNRINKKIKKNIDNNIINFETLTKKEILDLLK